MLLDHTLRVDVADLRSRKKLVAVYEGLRGVKEGAIFATVGSFRQMSGLRGCRKPGAFGRTSLLNCKCSSLQLFGPRICPLLVVALHATLGPLTRSQRIEGQEPS